MKHAEEMCYWSRRKDGTDVWEYKNSWLKVSYPMWEPECMYIVNDEWAELRKMQFDGYQLQYLEILGFWSDRNLTLGVVKRSSSADASKRWRVKPTETDGEVYEWRWICREGEVFYFTSYFKNESEMIESESPKEVVERYENSRRSR